MSFHWWLLTVTVIAEIQRADAWGQLQLYSNKKNIVCTFKISWECHQIYQCIDWSKWEVRSCGIAWGLPAFPLEEGELVSTYSGASLDTRACRTFIQRCACRVECLKSPLGTDEVWFECWAEKKIDWMVDIDSSKSTSKGWLLSLCWHMCYGCRFMLVR